MKHLRNVYTNQLEALMEKGENDLYKKPCKNTDTILWQKKDDGGMVSVKVSLTDRGLIGINYYGKVVEKPAEEWIRDNWNCPPPMNPESSTSRADAPAAEGDLTAKIDNLRLWCRKNGLTDKEFRKQITNQINRVFLEAPTVKAISERLTETIKERDDLESQLAAARDESERLKRIVGFTKISSITSYLTNRHIHHIDTEFSEYYKDAVNAMIDHIRLFMKEPVLPASADGSGAMESENAK